MKKLLTYNQETIDEKFAEIEERLSLAVLSAINKLREEIAELVEDGVADRIKTIEEERQERLESNTPYFEILSEIDVDNDSRTKLELDWNPSFIKELKAKGYHGANEQQIIQQWIKKLAEQLDTDQAE
jgi:DNA-binding Lrp family transcriptional regulator